MNTFLYQYDTAGNEYWAEFEPGCTAPVRCGMNAASVGGIPGQKMVFGRDVLPALPERRRDDRSETWKDGGPSYVAHLGDVEVHIRTCTAYPDGEWRIGPAWRAGSGAR